MTEAWTVTICPDHPDSEDARNLVRRLDEDLLQRYPGLQATHGLHPEDVADPDLTFFIARIDGCGVGCGALRRLEPRVGEIKRMYVLPEFRGRGIARQILEALESRARELGHAEVRLETGIGQPEAIGLYKSAGYSKAAAFGEYAGNPFSVYFQKRLL
jgi:putative acetyltransferase